jgi:S1 RNA binding domain/Zc3h12a-like Ribonuclease NYN domain
MTTGSPTHVVVDGSNIATEGRSMPSLTQLNDAVLAYRAEHPNTTVTVVVDATFGHRIPKSEVAEFDAAIANNELVAPPAGAVGRGDAFVLGIANKANATVLSNDSFQEFHGRYDWLFDEGRLVGGKPVPHVGWVFVERTPVRGPISRKAVRDSKRVPATAEGRRGRGRATATVEAVEATPKKASREASLPMPVPTSPPPGRAIGADGVNELMPFLEFVERHPVGTSVNAVVDSYSSHGAYVRVGDVKGYVPLRSMGDPPPRSAREVMKIGDAVTLVVASFAPARRSVDLSMPQIPVPPTAADEVAVEAMVDAVAPPSAGRGRGRRRAEAQPAAAVASTTPASATEPVTQTRGRKQAAKKVAERTIAEPAAARSAAKAPAKKATAKKVAASESPTAPAKKAAAKAAPAPAKKAATTPTPIAPAKKAAARKTSAPVPATKAAAKKVSGPTKKPAAPAKVTTPAKVDAAAKVDTASKTTKATKATKAPTAAGVATAAPPPAVDAVQPAAESPAVSGRRRRAASKPSS